MRRITRLVQLIPFVYLFFYGTYLLTEQFLDVSLPGIADSLLYVSTPATVVFLIMGKWLKLCAWFKTACLMPMLSRVENYVDCFIYQFTQNEIILVNSLIGLFALVFLVKSYRHFFSNGR